MENLDILEAAKGGPFVVGWTVDGQPRSTTLKDPADIGFMQVLHALQIEHAPGTPPCKDFKRAALFAAWAAHYDLPPIQDAQRLCYLLDHYRSALVYDLSILGIDIGQLWRSRRWRTALDIIDHLPSHTWYSASVANDEEHAKMIAESIARRQAAGESIDEQGPSMVTWSPEVAAITAVQNEIKSLTYLMQVVNHDSKSAKPEPPKPAPSPKTPLEAAIKRAKYEDRKARHESLALRMLPHKRPKA